MAGPYIKDPLIHMINESLEQGSFPCALKTGKLIPLLKNGDKKKMENSADNLSVIVLKTLGTDICNETYEFS
jgi:hypothetical protein